MLHMLFHLSVFRRERHFLTFIPAEEILEDVIRIVLTDRFQYNAWSLASLVSFQTKQETTFNETV